jgi:hypothetical protein
MIINTNPALSACFLITLAALSMTACVYDSREENNVLEPCDTTSVTFMLTIKPILKNNCIVCHSGESPANGLDYTKYPDIVTVASDGRLVGAINHRAGFEPMPRFAPKLPSCEIQKIEKWVRQGALNN